MLVRYNYGELVLVILLDISRRLEQRTICRNVREWVCTFVYRCYWLVMQYFIMYGQWMKSIASKHQNHDIFYEMDFLLRVLGLTEIHCLGNPFRDSVLRTQHYSSSGSRKNFHKFPIFQRRNYISLAVMSFWPELFFDRPHTKIGPYTELPS